METITKEMIKILSLIARGADTREKIAKDLKLSKTWISDNITKLERLKFIYKIRKGNTIHLQISDTSYSQEFKNMLESPPYVKFEDFLYGLNFKILTCCLFGWKTSKSIANQLNLTKKTIWNRLIVLTSRGLLAKNKKLYITNQKAWPSLYSFLEKYRMFYNGHGKILWKFDEEQVFCIAKKEDIQGSITGFSRYTELNIPIWAVKYCCYLPKKKLKKEDIFIHSILEISDSREVMLALAFYLKHNLNKKILDELAMKYDCLEKLKDLEKILKQEKTDIFHLIKEKELKEFFKQYNLKWK